MPENLTASIFGYTGSVLLVTSLIPQVYHTYKTKFTDDLSFLFIVMQILTGVCFLAYGILLEELPLIIANVGVQIQIILLLIAKIMYTNNETRLLRRMSCSSNIENNIR